MLDFVTRNLRTFWAAFQWTTAEINGAQGIVLQQDGKTVAAISFAYDDAGQATNIYVVSNPDKLTRLSGS